MSISQLIKIASNASALEKFVTAGDMARLMGEVELSAAKEALLNSRIANDPRSQVWSAVNHLETAHHSFLRIYKGRGRFYDSLATRASMDLAAKKDKWTLCLMAICYKFLGEEMLWRDALSKAGAAHTDDEVPPWISYFVMIPQVLDPRVHYIGHLERQVPYISNEELAALRTTLG